ncbi:hypothetical protein LTR54_018521, partial [Friedmanniomyces endolithicus]
PTPRLNKSRCPRTNSRKSWTLMTKMQMVLGRMMPWTLPLTSPPNNSQELAVTRLSHNPRAKPPAARKKLRRKHLRRRRTRGLFRPNEPTAAELDLMLKRALTSRSMPPSQRLPRR